MTMKGNPTNRPSDITPPKIGLFLGDVLCSGHVLSKRGLHQETDELLETLGSIMPPLHLTAEIMNQEYRKSFLSSSRGAGEKDDGTDQEGSSGSTHNSVVALPCPGCALEKVMGALTLPGERA